jgi:hypothetical protein
MSQTFNERLNQILPKLTSSDLLTNQGLGNEIGFWIFDYPPEEEMAMRAFLQDVVMPALGKHQPAIKAADVNLFDLVIGLLEERKLLDKAIEMQRTPGRRQNPRIPARVLKEDKLAERLVAQHDIAEPRRPAALERRCRLSHAAHPHAAHGAACPHEGHAAGDVLSRQVRRLFATPLQQAEGRSLLPCLPARLLNTLTPESRT